MSDNELRILIVEDDVDSVRALQDALRTGGSSSATLTVAPTLQQASELLDTRSFDVVFLALFLSDSQGLETLAYARDAARKLPIIVLVDGSAEDIGRLAMQRGAQDYLVRQRFSGEVLERSLRYAIDRHQMQEELRALSLTDELTGLCNRYGFLALAEQPRKIAARSKADLLILCVNVDNIREINDAHGRSHGDEALKSVATLLNKTFRSSDIMARLSGGKFAIAVLDLPAGNTIALTSRLRRNLDAFNKGASFPLSMSVGVARIEPGTRVSLSDILAQAETAMLAHKQTRKAA